jgi:hypothetical protein
MLYICVTKANKMTNATINIANETILKETEKAICVRMSGTCSRSGDQKGFDMWLPKSVVKENEVPMWVLIKNGREKGFDSVHFYGNKLGVKCF